VFAGHHLLVDREQQMHWSSKWTKPIEMDETK